VVGLDASSEVIAQAETYASTTGVTNVRFETGDLFALVYDDATFDVVHAHQVLQHLADPQSALTELRRVLRPGGFLAARDSDYSAFTWAPGDPALDRWRQIYLAVTERNGHDARIGPSLLGLAQAAGFADVTVSSTCWTFADPPSREWWGGLWADRVRFSRLAEQAVAYELSDTEELESIAGAFLAWAVAPDGVFVTPSVEILARR
jgi:SAM-dependent methyltransferase